LIASGKLTLQVSQMIFSDFNSAVLQAAQVMGEIRFKKS
jgi:hypothetical protein